MNASTSGGAIAVVAFAPMLMLALKVRRRGGVNPQRNRRYDLAATVSLVLVGIGTVIGGVNGAFG